jgi:hypothetical protein
MMEHVGGVAIAGTLASLGDGDMGRNDEVSRDANSLAWRAAYSTFSLLFHSPG